MGQEVFDVAEVLAPRLKSLPGPRIDRFHGFVNELRGQPRRDDPGLSGEVRFTLFDRDEEIRARADPSATDYEIAGKAHSNTDVVGFKGVLERQPRLSRIKNVADFSIFVIDDDVPPGDATQDEPGADAAPRP